MIDGVHETLIERNYARWPVRRSVSTDIHGARLRFGFLYLTVLATGGSQGRYQQQPVDTDSK